MEIIYRSSEWFTFLNLDRRVGNIQPAIKYVLTVTDFIYILQYWGDYKVLCSVKEYAFYFVKWLPCS